MAEEESLEQLSERTFRTSAIQLLCESLPEYNVRHTIKKGISELSPPAENFWDKLHDELFSLCPATTFLKPVLNSSGKVEEIVECRRCGDELASSSTNMSLQRIPFLGSTTIKGSSSNVPFFPGGFDEELSRLWTLTATTLSSVDEEQYLNFENLLHHVPGFEHDTYLGSKTETTETNVKKPPEINLESVDIFDLLDYVGGAAPIFTPPSKEETTVAVKVPTQTTDATQETSEDIDSLLENQLKERQTIVGPKDSKEFHYARRIDTSADIPEYKEIFPHMAKQYPFALDPFQQAAVCSMERGESVFVAAHTSAGKTVVAEYAISLCKLHKTRAIYTSPIKALSNQKFRDFKLIFEEVGLITGDIQLFPEAFCLIMTTEILRSMLYNGSEIIRELEWVIFDEVHYINDAERGHVWEEVLIMLPAHVKIVMLSATVPNAAEFADWVGRIKNRRIDVVYTAKRPVPLEHHLYTGQDGKTRHNMFLVVDKEGQFQKGSYAKARESKEFKKTGQNAARGGKNPGFQPGNNRNDQNVYINLVEHLRSKDQLPAVCFVFSRRRCDDNAQLLLSADLTTALEKNHIKHFFSQCIQRLKGTDKELPQVMFLKELCTRGVGVHHSGILPILKEVVELLFQKGYVKVLFATETFAMGVNMPARSVVFDSLQKHDGTELRLLTAGEYVQMAGRAGRRGLDATGNVVVLQKGQCVMDFEDIHKVILGKQANLESKFRVTYTMLLNLLRVEQLKIEDMLQRSYVESGSLRGALKLKQTLELQRQLLEAMHPPTCTVCFPELGDMGLQSYIDLLITYIERQNSLWNVLYTEDAVNKLLIPGRIVIVHLPCFAEPRAAILLSEKANMLKVVLPVAKNLPDDAKCDQQQAFGNRIRSFVTHGIDGHLKWNFDASQMIMSYNIAIDSLVAITRQTIKKMNAADLLNEALRYAQPRFRNNKLSEDTEKVLTTFAKIDETLSNEDLLLAGKDFKITRLENHEEVSRWLSLREHLLEATSRNSAIHCVHIESHLGFVLERLYLVALIRDLEAKLAPDSLALSKEYHDRLKMLKTLGYVDEHDLVTFKGRVACEIHHQELLVTELVLDGKLHKRKPAEVAALLSTTTCQFKSQEEIRFTPNSIFDQLYQDVFSTEQRIKNIARENKIQLFEIGDEIRFDLMEVVYLWAQGESFSTIMQKTDCQEGIIVRCIQRLGEVCKDVRNAARIVGDPALFEKMEQVSSAIKRDIVFAASLYTSV
ncbi:unnamed protein product, partial [Mesorhabditis belari]|uniref:Helicase SKI2W n=1 Tax=Mesorhabditis belari TaxID=2138241 RepID=A0AAF3FIJ8_9BILA